VFVPDLPGCIATGASKEQASIQIQEAIAFHLEGLAMEEMPVPSLKSEAEELLVDW